MKFFHYRVIRDNKIMSNGGVTVCYDEETNKLGVAQCSPHDTYNKRLGRIKAGGRAKSKDAVEIIGDVESVTDIDDFIKMTFSNKDLARRVRS